MARSPNIVVVMADQHRADSLGCAGNPAVQTPNIDRLAARGVRFDRVNCQGPLCMPARASLATERYVRDHGVYTNSSAIASSSPTHLHALREAGYHTVMLGKAHLTRPENGVPKHTDDMAYLLEALGYDEVRESGDKFSLSIPHLYTDYLAERGLLEIYLKHMRDRSYQGKENGGTATKIVPMWDTTPIDLPLDAYADSWHGVFASDWIDQYSGDQPFYAFIGFPGPHDPWDAPREAIDWYADVDIPMPGSTLRPDQSDAGTYGRLLDAFLRLSDNDTLQPDAIAAMRRAYYADITVIDDGVGRIVDALERRGDLDNTWILYTSDHGDMGGDHGMFSKCVFYDGALKVPLVVRPPGGTEPSVVHDIVEHFDLSATVRDIAGAPGVDGAESRSLLGYVTGDAPAAREVSVSENWGFALFETERYKLVVDEDALAPVFLVDRHEDPFEDVNRVADPECTGVVGEMMETLVRPFFVTGPARPHPSMFTGRN